MSHRRDVIYLYDGSFDGLLTAIFESYYNREIPVSIEENDKIQQALFCDYVTIVTDFEKAERVFKSIENKISKTTLQNLYYTYLSDLKDKGRLCLDYVRAGYKFGPRVNLHLNIDCISAVINTVQRVKREAEQYRQFVRFSELEGGIYYSEIEPKCDILAVISPHFVKRFPQMPWIIHDLNRHICSVYNGKSFYISPTDSVPNVKYSDDEKSCRRLWKKFYDAIEIKERRNERCRMSHMPKRFWKHLTEFEEQ